MECVGLLHDETRQEQRFGVNQPFGANSEDAERRRDISSTAIRVLSLWWSNGVRSFVKRTPISGTMDAPLQTHDDGEQILADGNVVLEAALERRVPDCAGFVTNEICLEKGCMARPPPTPNTSHYPGDLGKGCAGRPFEPKIQQKCS